MTDSTLKICSNAESCNFAGDEDENPCLQSTPHYCDTDCDTEFCHHYRRMIPCVPCDPSTPSTAS